MPPARTRSLPSGNAPGATTRRRPLSTVTGPLNAFEPENTTVPVPVALRTVTPPVVAFAASVAVPE